MWNIGRDIEVIYENEEGAKLSFVPDESDRSKEYRTLRVARKSYVLPLSKTGLHCFPKENCYVEFR
mgnify:CR=1 FL=1